MRAWADKAATLVENTTMPLADVAARCGVSAGAVRLWYSKAYTPEYRSERKRENYRQSKLGDKNPMKGKFGHQHHNFVGRASDNRGYYTVLRPEWWTGANKGRVFEHHVVYALANGLTEIPKGHVVHHIDHDPGNNVPSNLQLMTISEHMKLHNAERNVQNVSGDDE